MPDTIPTLDAISPIDGRYRDKTQALAPYFSEAALIKYRVLVELRYLQALRAIPLPQLAHIDPAALAALDEIVEQFALEQAAEIKAIERTTNHDVKAVEYFVKKALDERGLGSIREFVHFGLTSQDINNTAIPLSIKEALEEVYYPLLRQLLDALQQMAQDWGHIPMLARTHGQPASPTSLGKEMAVFAVRLEQQLAQLQQVPFSAKFGGATGNMNAHVVTYPGVDWHSFARDFVAGLGLERSFPTTQIEHYDNLAALFHALCRINTILIDFSRDIWTYISMEYFRQRTVAGEVGSSAMPHKVNPIDFENAEGNLGLANAMMEHLAAKLPVSRLQRDLTDSTVLRNVGVPLGHTVIAFHALLKGMGKLLLNEAALHRDLENNWMVVAEGIQNILRREGYPEPYEALKALTRGKAHVGEAELQAFIAELAVSPAIKAELAQLSPHNYTGR